MYLPIEWRAACGQARVLPHPRVAVVSAEFIEQQPGCRSLVGNNIGVDGVVDGFVGEQKNIFCSVEAADLANFPELPARLLGGKGSCGARNIDQYGGE